MAKRHDGGAAFPRPIDTNGATHYEDREVSYEQDGMALRDYFAAAALPAVMRARTALVNADLANDLNQESIAEECYELADALLDARARVAEEA